MKAQKSLALGFPCLTLRPNTERPVTISQGTNRLCTVDSLEAHITQALSQRFKSQRVPELWDGRTAQRVVASVKRFLRLPANGYPNVA